MNTIKIYKNFVLCIGLLPAIICMLLCCIFPDAAVLYFCGIVSLIHATNRFFQPDTLEYNTVLLHTECSIALLAAAKAIGGDWILPEASVPLTLGILILCFSLFYLLTATHYSRFLIRFGHETGVNNYWATVAIILPSLVYLFLLSTLYAFFQPLSRKFAYFLTNLMPPLVCLASFRLDLYYSRCRMQEIKSIPLIRVAAVCNGKVYVIPQKETKEYWDMPMCEVCLGNGDVVEEALSRLKTKYQENLNNEPDLRFSLRYQFDTPFGSPFTILLYILPLKEEKEIHFEGGRFVTPAEIMADTDKQFSLFLKQEAEHLQVVAETWKDYQ